MSFLGFESFLIPLGASTEDAKQTFRAALTARAWQIAYESAPLAINGLGTMTNPANAFDWDVNTYAYVTGVLPCWVGCKASNVFTPTRVTLQGDTNAATEAPANFSVDWSDDGTTWNTLQSWTGETAWGITEKRRYAIIGATPHLYWRLNVTARQAASSTVTLASVIFEDAAGRQLCSNTFLQLIPPATETIGNAYTRDLVHLEFGTNFIRPIPITELLQDLPQMVAIWPKTAGNTFCAVTINGTSVNGATGTAGSTAAQNLRSLYEAIIVSTDSNFTAFNWSYDYAPTQNANDANEYIYGVQNSATAKNLSITPNASTNAGIIGNHQGPTVVNPNHGTLVYGAACDATTDLVNGFVYYLQVSSRAIAIASKTNAGYYGPFHCSYSEHNRAISALPVNAGIWVSPIELYVGYDGATSNLSSNAYPSHTWGFHALTRQGVYGMNEVNGPATPFNGPVMRDKFYDQHIMGTSYNPITVGLTGSGFSNSGDNATDDFQIHRMNQMSMAQTGNYDGTASGVTLSPILDVQDWFRFRGSATNESLVLVADTVAYTQLATDMDNTTQYGSITMSDTSMLNATGYVIIENEVIQYTAKNDATKVLTLAASGRAKYATLMAKHPMGTNVYQGLWFVVINGGALMAGYNKPS